MFNRPQAYGELIEALQTFCQEELRVEPRRIRVDLDSNMVLILLEQFFSPASVDADQKWEEAEKTTEAWLRDTLQLRFRLMVEAATGRKVAHAQVFIDFPPGNLIGVFVFTDTLARREEA